MMELSVAGSQNLTGHAANQPFPQFTRYPIADSDGPASYKVAGHLVCVTDFPLGI